MQAGALAKSRPIVVAPLDARTRQLPELSQAVRRPFLRLQAIEQLAKTRRFERRCYAFSDACVVVSRRDRDTLQLVIKLLREADFGIDMQFINYRTN